MKYYQAEEPGSFSGEHSFQKALGRPVKRWLEAQDAYTLHKPVKRKFLRRPTIVPGAHFQMQADLIDFSRLKKYNNNCKYILVLIDVFSKVAHAAVLKNKNSRCMIKAFTNLLEKTHFSKLQTDRGTKFTNASFRRWLKERNIEVFHSYNFDTKATIAERFIRTLKEKLWRYFTHTNSRHYIEILPKLIHSYNHSFHRSIQRTPALVDRKNQEEVWQTLYGDRIAKDPKLKEGDSVRLMFNKAFFRKGYLPSWTEEIFTIHRAFCGQPPYYKIKDDHGEIIEGTFYAEELQKVLKGDVFKIEKILNRRQRGKQRQFLIKWVGYPDSFNSWVNQQDIVHYDQAGNK